MPIAAPQLTQEAKLEAGLRVPSTAPKIDPVWLAVAAGDMHGEGRLFMPSPSDPMQVPNRGPAREPGDEPRKGDGSTHEASESPAEEAAEGSAE